MNEVKKVSLVEVLPSVYMVEVEDKYGNRHGVEANFKKPLFGDLVVTASRTWGHENNKQKYCLIYSKEKALLLYNLMSSGYPKTLLKGGG